MKCKKCYKETDLLHRVNELGVDGIWWCDACIKKHEPELHKNIHEDTVVFDIYKAVKEIENDELNESRFDKES